MAKVNLKIACYAAAGAFDADLRRPFFLVETFISADGWRTRVCDGQFASWNDAHAHMVVIIAKAEETFP